MSYKLIEKLGGDILDVVLDNFGYFREKPAHLAWVMMNYDLIHRVGKNSPNPKNAILCCKDNNLLLEEDMSLLYDSWAITVSNWCEFPDTNPNLPLESKQNKTLEEWIALLTDDKYSFKDQYPDEFSVKDTLLCSYGTGYGWNRGGFVADIGPEGTDQIIFAGYTRCEESIDIEIRERIIKIISSNRRIRKKAEEYLKKATETAERIYSGEKWIEVINPHFKEKEDNREKLKKSLERLLEINTPEDLKINIKDLLTKLDYTESSVPESKERIYSPLSEYSNLVTMPVNAHKSYTIAGIEIAREIVNCKKYSKESKKFARKFLKQRS